MTDTSAHIDKDWIFWFPPFRVFFDGVHGEPSRHSVALNSHELVEVNKLLGMLLEPYERRYVRITGLLKYRVSVIRDVLVFGRS